MLTELLELWQSLVLSQMSLVLDFLLIYMHALKGLQDKIDELEITTCRTWTVRPIKFLNSIYILTNYVAKALIIHRWNRLLFKAFDPHSFLCFIQITLFINHTWALDIVLIVSMMYKGFTWSDVKFFATFMPKIKVGRLR